MKNDEALFWWIVAGLIALGAFITAVLWLFEQWWFVPLLVTLVAIAIIVVIAWVKSRM